MSRFRHGFLQFLSVAAGVTALGTNYVPEPYNHVVGAASVLFSALLGLFNHQAPAAAVAPQEVSK